MFKVLKNNDGFSGLIGLIMAIVVIGIMSAMILPTFTARMNYKQAQYAAGVTKTIENAENAYMAKNGSFADLVTLSQNGYLSPQFLQSLQPANNPGGPYPQPNWITLELANQTVNLCIDNNGGCPDNPSGNNYFIGLYSIPVNYANYIEHELPGSGIGSQGGGLEYVAYAAPVPSAPPVNTSATIIWRVPGYYTWNVPSNITTLQVNLAGGGGGGGGGGYSINCSGAGGSGGGGGASAILINNNLAAIAGGGNSGDGGDSYYGGSGYFGYPGNNYYTSLSVSPGDNLSLYVASGGIGGGGWGNIVGLGEGGWGYIPGNSGNGGNSCAGGPSSSGGNNGTPYEGGNGGYGYVGGGGYGGNSGTYGWGGTSAGNGGNGGNGYIIISYN